jgi:hypothetical protein
MMAGKHIGSDFDAFLKEQGILEEVRAELDRRLVAFEQNPQRSRPLDEAVSEIRGRLGTGQAKRDK